MATALPPSSALTVRLTGPADGSTLYTPAPVSGTVGGAGVRSWTLEHRLDSDRTWTALASGAGPTTGSALATFDPTRLLNGLYELRLSATDRQGRVVTDSAYVVVGGDFKLGVYRHQVVDLELPLVGPALRLARTYDSRDRRQGDFGLGWSLDLTDVRAEATGLFGLGWEVVGATASTAGWCLQPTRSHRVSVTFADGRLAQFQPAVDTPCGASPPEIVTVSFRPLDGTTAALAPLGDVYVSYPGGEPKGTAPQRVELLDLATATPLDPQRFVLTLPDGDRLTLRRQGGLERIVDRYGNSLIFDRSGITHASGTRLRLERDSQGRVTRLVDPLGQALRFSYDASGRLRSATDREGHTTAYAYSAEGRLLSVTDPLGTSTARPEYDADGRVIAVLDAVGQRTAFRYDIAGRWRETKDRRGGTTVETFDLYGRLLSRRDPAGGEQRFEYDARGAVVAERGPEGATQERTYDAAGNVATASDPLGNTTRSISGPYGRPLSVQNASGHITRFEYNAQGSPIAVTDAAGATVRSTYDARGLETGRTDATGRLWTAAFSANGRPAVVADPLGNRWEYLSDASGRLIASRDPTGLRTVYTHDHNDRIVEREVAGEITFYEYDAAGRLAAEIDSLGGSTRHTYDALGRRISTQHADGATERRYFDAEGNVIATVDAAGRATQYSYDALDRPTQVTYPDGSVERREYDAAGRIVRILDRGSHVTRHVYDAAGRRVQTIDPLGGVTRHDYDATGNVVAQTDPLGRTTRYEYEPGLTVDGKARLARVIFLDGASERFGYDAAGRLVERIDAAGGRTVLHRDAAGRIDATIDPLGQTTQYQRNAQGRLVAMIGPLGERSAWAYDPQGRPLEVTSASGATERVTYDLGGRQDTRTTPAGELFMLRHDARGRLLERVLPDATRETYTYAPDGLVQTITDTWGTTRYDYQPGTRYPARVTTPDGRYIRYEYDARGKRTLVAHALAQGAPETVARYAYDALSRLAELQSAAGVTRYTYDSAGNRTAIRRPNGMQSTYAYDTRDRVVSVEHRGPTGEVLATFEHRYDAAGNRVAELRHDASRVDYNHDLLGRVTEERSRRASGELADETRYEYDAVGHLGRRTGTGGAVTYAYGAGGQLMAANGVRYTYDQAGNRVSMSDGAAVTRYVYDARNRLIRFEPSGGPSVSYTYAPNGARRSRSDAQGTEYYLVDDFLVDQPSAIADGMLGGPAARVLMVSDREGRARRRLTYGTTLLGWEEDGRSVELLDDGMGSTRLVMGAAGETLSSRSYLAHGAAVNASPGAAAGWSRSGGAVSFRGRLMDPESGLYVHGAAIYDPLTATVLNPSAGAFGWTAADGTLQDLTAGVSNASASAALGLWDGRAAPPSLFAFPDRRGYHGPERERLPASTPLLIAGWPDAAGSATEGGDRWLTRR